VTRGIWPEAVRGPGLARRPCGCWWDLITPALWRPCGVHMPDGHLSVVSATGDGHVARCLRRNCRWRSEAYWREADAVADAQRHWADTGGVGGGGGGGPQA
jgi:hypothetical protein